MKIGILQFSRLVDSRYLNMHIVVAMSFYVPK